MSCRRENRESEISTAHCRGSAPASVSRAGSLHLPDELADPRECVGEIDRGLVDPRIALRHAEVGETSEAVTPPRERSIALFDGLGELIEVVRARRRKIVRYQQCFERFLGGLLKVEPDRPTRKVRILEREFGDPKVRARPCELLLGVHLRRLHGAPSPAARWHRRAPAGSAGNFPTLLACRQ